MRPRCSMPPHCGTLDGPVVQAARQAFDQDALHLVLPYVFEGAEAEVRDAFRKTMAARGSGAAAKDVSDRWFFETVVRLHRAGEGAAFEGLKPAGLDWGPVVPKAETVLETGDPKPGITFLTPWRSGCANALPKRRGGASRTGVTWPQRAAVDPTRPSSPSS